EAVVAGQPAGRLRAARALAREVARGHLLEVEPDGEGPPASRDHDGAYFGVVGQLVDGRAHAVEEGPPHRVAAVGVVEPERGDVAVALDGDPVAHRECIRQESGWRVKAVMPTAKTASRIQWLPTSARRHMTARPTMGRHSAADVQSAQRRRNSRPTVVAMIAHDTRTSSGSIHVGGCGCWGP